MRAHRLRVVLVVLLLLCGGGCASTETGTTAASRTAKFECHGLEHSQVRGPRPRYAGRTLTRFRNHKRMCRALWLPRPRKTFVPQGIAVSGTTAWVSGFLYQPGFGARACRLVRMDLRTGERLDYRAVVGRVGRRPATYCRHGGGLLQGGRWLWIVEKNKLWLIDPTSTRSATIPATRVWRLQDPVRGSSIVATGDRVGLVPHQTTGRPRIRWFTWRSVLRRGVLELGVRPDGRRRAGQVASTPIPTDVQGAAYGPGGLYLTRSNLACGELVTPTRRIGFVPGAEGLQFGVLGERLWVVSESGARPYAGPRRPLTPAVASFEWPGLAGGRTTTCNFPGG